MHICGGHTTRKNLKFTYNRNETETVINFIDYARGGSPDP